MHLRPNGLVLLSPAELDGVVFIHLTSALDDVETASTTQCGSQTIITGYTEWITQGQPPLTLGWDWELSAEHDTPPRPKRLGPPRTNLCLTSSEGQQLDWEHNLVQLGRWIDERLIWAPTVMEQLESAGPVVP